MAYVLLRLLLVACLCHAMGCEESAKSSMKGQSNVTLTFYGRAVDQDGKALSGAKFEFRLEAYPKNWNFDNRDQANESSTIAVVSGADGNFKFTITGCTLRRMSAEYGGYEHFCDLDHESRPENIGISNYFYSIVEWGDQQYRSDPEHPAIFVFVKEGLTDVSALPCKGGYRAYGKKWILHEPGWPRKPSLKQVRRKAEEAQ